MIDRPYLESLRALLKEDHYIILLDLYLKESQICMRDAKNALINEHWSILEELAHAMHNMSQKMHMTYLAELSTQLESKAQIHHFETCVQLLSLMITEHEHVIGEITRQSTDQPSD